MDLERRRPVDLLPDRTAETLAAWLRRHPGVEIASRDRGGAYADGIRQGAPQAVQVADRFHLLKNLGDALEAFLVRKHAVLRQAAQVLRERQTGQDAPDAPLPVPSAAPLSLLPTPDRPASQEVESAARTRTRRAQREKEARRTRRLTRYEAVLAHARDGMSQRQIARVVGLARGTVRRYLRAEAFPEQGPRPRSSKLRPDEAYLREQWDAGVQDAAVLWRALTVQGYTGGASWVRAFLSRWRIRPPGPSPVTTGRRPHDAPTGAAPPRGGAYSPRQVRWLLVQPDLIRDTNEQQFVETILELCPQMALIRSLTQEFAALVRTRQQRRELASTHLDAWLVAAEHSGIAELRGFAGGVRRDFAAVTAALTLNWSQGQTEGHVNRLKTLKRQMYGRASFPLLRQRLLHPA